MRPPRRRQPIRTTAVATVVAAVTLAAAWGVGLVWYVDQLPSEASTDTRRTDAIVVLTGGAGRLAEGLDLLERGRASRLFVSGVYRGIDVRQLLATTRSGGGALEDRIDIGNAVDTNDNARETAVWVRDHNIASIRLVTSAYHMPRSLMEFAYRMPNVEIVPAPVFSDRVKQDSWWMWPGTAALIATEFTKFLLAGARNGAETVAAALGATDIVETAGSTE
jgi:uncharacterized SAM-binding protein YcdF (DUF218 family)